MQGLRAAYEGISIFIGGWEHCTVTCSSREGRAFFMNVTCVGCSFAFDRRVGQLITLH